MKIRIANQGDFEEIAYVLRKSFNVYGSININKEYLDRLYEFDEGIRNGKIYVLEVDGKIVSLYMVVERILSIYPEILRVAGIANVGTLPEYRGRGYARELFNATLDRLKEDEYVVSALFAGYGEIAHRIYRRNDYHDVKGYNYVTCVLDEIREYAKILRETSRINSKEVLIEPFSESDIAEIKKLYDETIVRDYRCSVLRSKERFKRILHTPVLGTWFLSTRGNNKTFVLKKGNIVEGYVVTYYYRDSVLSGKRDRSAGYVLELVAKNIEYAKYLLAWIIDKMFNDGIKTIFIRIPYDIDICHCIGSTETFMVKILDDEKFLEIINKCLDKKQVSIENINNKWYKINEYNLQIRKDAFLKVFLGTTSLVKLYGRNPYIVEGDIRHDTLEQIDRVLRGNKKHYVSLIDQW